MEDIIHMSKKELERLRIIHKVIDNQITRITAAELMNISYRHTKRLVKRIMDFNDTKIIHASRGKESAKKYSQDLEKQIIDLHKTKYPDFGPTFFCEKLEEVEGIKISHETVRKWLHKHGINAGKRRSNRGDIHVWRERKHHLGELIQIDGSHHRWLENRLDQEFCLMGFVDDATGYTFGRFYEYEGIYPFFDSFHQYIIQNGLPEAIYVDNHSTYKTTRDASTDEDLRDKYAETQVEKALEKLNIRIIHAGSPEAKGRVERSFKTHQDRLVKEMRLANICTISDANKFLETYLMKHNQKFSKIPKSEHSLFRPYNPDVDYKWIFAVQDTRVIHKDYTIKWKNRLFLVQNPKGTNKNQKVLIKQAMNGDLQFETKIKIISVQEITEKQLSDTKSVNKQIRKILARKDHKKSKKSWMDGFYIGHPKPVLVK